MSMRPAKTARASVSSGLVSATIDANPPQSLVFRPFHTIKAIFSMTSRLTVPYRPDLTATARAWPFEEARKVVARIEKKQAKGETVGEVVFETGYGPSGLPHIGTFGEVARTTWVRHAFQMMSQTKTRLIAFSDDMDGLRKVPDNVPNHEMLTGYLGRSLTSIPDPFGTHESFGAHNNARLRTFLDRFGFEYEFLSATDCYK